MADVVQCFPPQPFPAAMWQSDNVQAAIPLIVKPPEES